MRHGNTLIATGLLLGITTLNAHANLTNYNGADNIGLVYSSVSNITWTQDSSTGLVLRSLLGRPAQWWQG